MLSCCLGRPCAGASSAASLFVEAFHGALSEAHSNHVDRLRDHQSRLGVLGDKAHTTASGFVEMEERNAEALRSVL